MAKGLVYRLIKEGIARGWWMPGVTVLCDPFGGIGSTGIAASAYGIESLSCELEPRFVEMAQANFALHRAAWEQLGLPIPVCIQGDSRNLRSIVAEATAGLCSPPYADTPVVAVHESGLAASGGIGAQYRKGNRPKGAGKNGTDYGTTPGQIGRMRLGAITSPPYANRLDDSGSGPIAEKGGKYGATAGQIGNLRLSGAVTSPPFSPRNNQPVIGQGARNELAKVGRRPEDGQQGLTEGNIAALPIGNIRSGSSRLDKSIAIGVSYYVCRTCLLAKIAEELSDERAAGVVPVLASISAQPSKDAPSQRRIRRKSQPHTSMSLTPTSLPSTLGTGTEEATVGEAMPGVSSVERLLNATGTNAKTQARIRVSLLSIISEMRNKLGVSGITISVTSSRSAVLAIADGTQDVCILCGVRSAEPSTRRGAPDLGDARSNADAKSAQPLSTAGSESYPQSLTSASCASCADNPLSEDTESVLASARQPATSNESGSTNAKILDSDDPSTYWGSVAQVYQELFDLFAPGSYLCLVVKAFVRDKAIVPLPQMTLDLLRSQGWQDVVWVDAMLTAEGTQGSMLAEVPEYRRKRVSFFRRLAESKGSPRIDAEVCLVVRKP